MRTLSSLNSCPPARGVNLPLLLFREHEPDFLVDVDVLEVAPVAVEFVDYLFSAVALDQKRSYHPLGEERPIRF